MGEVDKISNKFILCDHVHNSHDHSVLQGIDITRRNLTGLLIFRGKKAKFRGIFRGKFAEKSADFVGFSRIKSQNSWKNRTILRDFCGRKVKIRRKISQFCGILAEKSQISKDFRGKFLEKSADFMDFHGKFGGGGEFSQETISKKQPILLDFFWQISLKSINFASI